MGRGGEAAAARSFLHTLLGDAGKPRLKRLHSARAPKKAKESALRLAAGAVLEARQDQVRASGLFLLLALPPPPLTDGSSAAASPPDRRLIGGLEEPAERRPGSSHVTSSPRRRTAAGGRRDGVGPWPSKASSSFPLPRLAGKGQKVVPTGVLLSGFGEWKAPSLAAIAGLGEGGGGKEDARWPVASSPALSSNGGGGERPDPLPPLTGAFQGTVFQGQRPRPRPGGHDGASLPCSSPSGLRSQPRWCPLACLVEARRAAPVACLARDAAWLMAGPLPALGGGSQKAAAFCIWRHGRARSSAISNVRILTLIAFGPALDLLD